MSVCLTVFPIEIGWIKDRGWIDTIQPSTRTSLYVGSVDQKTHEKLRKKQERKPFSFFSSGDSSEITTDAYDAEVGFVLACDVVKTLKSGAVVEYLKTLDAETPVFLYWD